MSISTPSGSAKACLPMGHACKSLWMRTPACRRHVFSALIVEMRWRYCQVLPATPFDLEADVIEALAHASVQVFVAWSDQKTDFAVGERYFLVSGKLFDALWLKNFSVEFGDPIGPSGALSMRLMRRDVSSNSACKCPVELRVRPGSIG